MSRDWPVVSIVIVFIVCVTILLFKCINVVSVHVALNKILKENVHGQYGTYEQTDGRKNATQSGNGVSSSKGRAGGNSAHDSFLSNGVKMRIYYDDGDAGGREEDGRGSVPAKSN